MELSGLMEEEGEAELGSRREEERESAASF